MSEDKSDWLRVRDLDFKYQITDPPSWGEFENKCMAAYPTPSCQFLMFWPASGQDDFLPPSGTMLISAMTMTRTWAIENWDFRKHPDMTLHDLALKFIASGTEVTNSTSYVLHYVSQFPPVLGVIDGGQAA